MALKEAPVCDLGKAAVDFRLPGVDGRDYCLADVRGPKGTLVMFICNHCPYVIAIQDQLGSMARQLQEDGIGVVAINANDAERYPADNFDNMEQVAREQGYPFPYLFDETQKTARAYGAVCTPDFFGYNSDDELQYRGRLNSTTPSNSGSEDDPEELIEAMHQIALTGKGPRRQIPSMGCSIKWK